MLNRSSLYQRVAGVACKIIPLTHSRCNDPMIGSYNHYHLSPNVIPSGIQRWYGLVYIIQMAGYPRIRPRE